jgi:RND family efflux transporter MFP subunit
MNETGWRVCALVVMVSSLVGCPAQPPSLTSQPASVSGAKTQLAVGVSTVRAVRRNVDVTLEATGTVTPLQSVEVRSQMSGSIKQVHLREGQFVEAGQLLFTLDARNEQVGLAKARAEQAKGQALLTDAQRQLARSRELLAQQFVSQGAVDAAQAQVSSQQAMMAADAAAIAAAQVALSYARITAPSAGRVGAVNVFVGTTVQPAGVALATITQLNPVAVSFNVPQQYLSALLRMLRTEQGTVWAELPLALAAQASSADKAQRAAQQGTLRFVDNLIDPASGTVRVKAHFDNANEALWPGAFVRVRWVIETLQNAVVVPQASVIQGPKGRFVYVVGPDNKALDRPVQMVHVAGTDAVVTGVTEGERVVLQGQQNLRPGVAVVERSMPGAASATSFAPAASA